MWWVNFRLGCRWLVVCVLVYFGKVWLFLNCVVRFSRWYVLCWVELVVGGGGCCMLYGVKWGMDVFYLFDGFNFV